MVDQREILRRAGHALSAGGIANPQIRLKLAHLRLIAAIDDKQSISEAAQALNMSQPAASRMIAEMESLLRAKLFQRLSRGVRLTPLGQSLAGHAHTVLLQLMRAEQEFDDLRAGRQGVVAVGAVTAPACDLVAPAINDIRARAPGIEITMQVDNSVALARELVASRLDFILARVPDDMDARMFHCVTLGIEEASIIVRRGHPLLAQAPVGIAALGEWEWIMQPRDAMIRRAVDDLFLFANLQPPRCLINTTSIILTLMMVAHSDALAPIATGAARFIVEEATPGALTELPINFAIKVRPYSLITLRDRPLSQSATIVYEMIRTLARPMALEAAM